MKRLPLLLIILLSCIFLTLAIPPFVLNPSLYTSENDALTLYHYNPMILSVYPNERSADVSAMMQELLDAPEPIVLNVKVRDFEEAERALKEYKEKSQYFNRVVINLDLTESVIGDLQRENRKNLATLERIINESAQFDKVNRLEIQYRLADDPALLYTITYEGQAVQQALEKSTKEYLDRQPKIVALGNQLDLDTRSYRESGEILKDLRETDRIKQETRNLNQPVLSPSALSLSVSPNSGYFGDTLQIAGAYTFMPLPEVTLILDNRDWKSVVPDPNGIFGSPFTIGRIRSGDHFVVASSNNRYSNIASFNVIPVDTNLTLDTYPGKHWNEVYMDGRLVTDVIPVANASVTILVDEFEVMSVETDQEGYYSTAITLTPGNHTLQSSFDGPEYPLNSAVSDMRSIMISPTGRVPWSVPIGVGIILVSIFVSVWYLRRRDKTITIISSESLHPQPAPIAEPMITPIFPPDILGHYKTLFETGEWSEAAHVLYRFLIDRFVLLSLVTDPYSLTPRELTVKFSSPSLDALFRSFISRYEEVRYGGYPLLKEDPLLTGWMEIISRSGEGKNE
jgi:hypothetical protein